MPGPSLMLLICSKCSCALVTIVSFGIALKNLIQAFIYSSEAPSSYNSTFVLKTSEESDTLEAVIMGGHHLKSKQNNNKKVLLVFDSGLCTIGLLNQNEINYLDSDYDIVIKELKRVSALPDLQQIDVEFIGLGSATEKQVIPHSYQEKIRQFWIKIIEASGGNEKNTSLWGTPVLGDCADNLPDVTEVIFCKDQLNIYSTKKELLSNPIKLSDESIKFKPNSDEFDDPNKASIAIQPIYDYMNQNDEVIVIAGMTASVGSEKACEELSLKRAEACRAELSKMGVDPTRIICIGLGRSSNCLRVVDTYDDGSLNEEMAQINRAIYVFSFGSETARVFSNEIEDALNHE